MSLYKITRLTSEKENLRISQLGRGPLYNQFFKQQSDDKKDISGVNSAAMSANEPTKGVEGFGYIAGRGAIGKGGDFMGGDGIGQPAEMTISPEILLQIQSMPISAEEKKRLINRYLEGELTDFAAQTKELAYNELIPKLQTLHSQFITSSPTGRENFMTEAKAILDKFKGSMSMSDLNYIRANFPGFARLI
jgi:hypothetical protein